MQYLLENGEFVGTNIKVGDAHRLQNLIKF